MVKQVKIQGMINTVIQKIGNIGTLGQITQFNPLINEDHTLSTALKGVTADTITAIKNRFTVKNKTIYKVSVEIHAGSAGSAVVINDISLSQQTTDPVNEKYIISAVNPSTESDLDIIVYNHRTMDAGPEWLEVGRFTVPKAPDTASPGGSGSSRAVEKIFLGLFTGDLLGIGIVSKTAITNPFNGKIAITEWI